MFERIKKAIEKYHSEHLTKSKKYIKNGADWDKDAGIRQYLNSKQLKAFEEGKTTRSEAIKQAITNATKESEKNKQTQFNKLAQAEQEQEPKNIKICVNWKKSKTWGYNPHAEAWSCGHYTTGMASGCGYDKRTAAIGEALNDNPAILKALYIAEEKRLMRQKNKRPSRRDFIGYGSACDWSPVPYFEGGVGISSFIRIFNNLGYEVVEMSGDTFDGYAITKKERAKK